VVWIRIYNAEGVLISSCRSMEHSP